MNRNTSNSGYEAAISAPIPPIDKKKRSGFGCLIGSMVGCGTLTILLVIVGALAVQKIGRNKDIQKVFGQIASVGGCSKNMVQVRDALKRYRHDHKGAYPADLKELSPRYLANSNALWCGNGKDAAESLKYFRPSANATPTTVVARVKSLEMDIMGKQHQIAYLALRVNGDIVQEQTAVQIVVPANSPGETND